MRYIQRRGDGYLETVDEFTTYREAREMLKEYRLSDPRVAALNHSVKASALPVCFT